MRKFTVSLWYILVISIIARYVLRIPIAPNLFLVRVMIPLLVFLGLVKILNKLFKPNWMYFKLTLLTLYSIITIIWSVNVTNYIISVIQLIGLILIFILTDTYVVSHIRLINTIKTLYVLHISSVIIGIYEITTNHHLPTSKFTLEYSWPIKGTTSYFYNPNEFGIFIVFMLPIIYFFLSNAKRISGKIFHIIIILLTFIILVYTDSRLSLITAILQLIAFKILHDNLFSTRNMKRVVKNNLIFTSVILCVGIIVVFFEELGLSDIRAFDQMGYLLSGIGDPMSSVSLRMIIVSTMLDISINSFGFGVGLGQLPEYIANYNWLIDSKNAHSYFLRILGEQGIIGILLMLSIIFQILMKLYKTIIRESEKNQFHILLFSIMMSVGSFLIAGFGADTVHISTILWLFLGIAYTAPYIVTSNNSMIDKYKGD